MNVLKQNLPGLLRAKCRIRLAFQLLGALALCAGSTAALAQQGLDCNQLLGQIRSLDQANAQSNPYAAAVQKQRVELSRSGGYAHSIGCDRQQFLFFGSPPPAQCPQLNAQIERMRANLSQLEANAARSGNSPQRQQLAARYNAYCRQQRPRGFFESLFGDGNPNPAPGDAVPGEVPPADQTPPKPAGGSEALCVRTCDGGFFPLIYSAQHANPDTLTDLCKASCPNAEVKVYTRVPGQEVKTAVGLDGSPYMDLPAALKFEKSYDPACTCKPPGQTWAEALQNAEKVLGHERKGDIIVTPEKSAEMSRPKLDAAQRSKLIGTTSARAAAAAAKAGKSSDDLAAHDAASASQVPTASDDSAGIAAGDLKPTASFTQGEGKTVEVTNPDGSKHAVRIVGPQP
jgi:hypothetical protein